MRLWHYKLIPHLPRQQLLGQHRECCAMRGKGWGKKHSTVDYVWAYSYQRLFLYHELVMLEMYKREYKVDPLWYNPLYRGKIIGKDISEFTFVGNFYEMPYPEHNDQYYQECIDNLKAKGVVINGS